MHIQKENTHPFGITHYTQNTLTIGEVTYNKPLMVSHGGVQPWNLPHGSIATYEDLYPLIKTGANILLIGAASAQNTLSLEYQALLSQQKIGVECMSIGAACRTFNVLLQEGRPVVLGIIFT